MLEANPILRRHDMMINRKRELLERLALAGQATRLLNQEIATAKTLEADGLLFLAGMVAVVTPKGRRRLAELALPTKPTIKLSYFLD